MASRHARTTEQPREGGDFDPVHEWLDDGGSYLLRLYLEGFKKEDFRVHVDGTGRLTVIGQDAGRASSRLHKVFQLPNTADLDGITGRFDRAVLTLTVPKLRQPDGSAVAPSPQPKVKEDQRAAAGSEPKDPQPDKAASVPNVGHAEAERSSTTTVRGKDEEDDKRKAEKAAPSPLLPSGEKKANVVRHEDQDEKTKASAAEHRAYVAREAARRIEAARAKVAEAKAAAERTGGQWKERAAAEGLKWAQTIGQNKEMIATAVAAFTLGVFVSQALTRG